jgi:hypothetical protein
VSRGRKQNLISVSARATSYSAMDFTITTEKAVYPDQMAPRIGIANQKNKRHNEGQFILEDDKN